MCVCVCGGGSLVYGRFLSFHLGSVLVDAFMYFNGVYLLSSISIQSSVPADAAGLSTAGMIGMVWYGGVVQQEE